MFKSKWDLKSSDLASMEIILRQNVGYLYNFYYIMCGLVGFCIAMNNRYGAIVGVLFAIALFFVINKLNRKVFKKFNVEYKYWRF